MSFQKYGSLLFNRRQLATLLLAFSSGLPLALISSTLQAWYTVSGISIVTIGFLSLIGIPYNYKILWAPLLDRFIPPLLGRRRGWILITQLLLILSLLGMSMFRPDTNPTLLAFIALFVAFFSASQDIVIDAYRVDLLPEKERAFGAALLATGYRVAMLVSGGLALILADHYGWRITYIGMSCLMLIGVIGAWTGPEPDQKIAAPQNLSSAIREPFLEFIKRNNAFLILLLIVLFKLGDAFTLSLNTTFLLRGVGFTLTDVGTANKIVGFFAILLGSFLGGALFPRLGLFRSLFIFGSAQAVAGLMFISLITIGKSFFLLILVVIIDNLTSGMANAAFLAWLMSLCDLRYSATQYALFSGLFALGRVFVGPIAGWLVHDYGWVNFYIITFFVSFPGLTLLWYLRKDIEQNYSATVNANNQNLELPITSQQAKI